MLVFSPSREALRDRGPAIVIVIGLSNGRSPMGARPDQRPDSEKARGMTAPINQSASAPHSDQPMSGADDQETAASAHRPIEDEDEKLMSSPPDEDGERGTLFPLVVVPDFSTFPTADSIRSLGLNRDRDLDQDGHVDLSECFPLPSDL